MSCAPSWQEPGIRAVLYSLIISASLLVGIVVVWILVACCASKKPQQKLPRMKKLWLFYILGCLEATPESAVIASATVGSFVDVPLIASLFLVSFINTANSALEELSVKPPRFLYTVLMASVYLAMGTLVLQVAAVLDHFEISEKDVSHIMTLFAGVLVGALYFLAILRGDLYLHHANHGRDREEHVEKHALKALKHLMNLKREQLYQVSPDQPESHVRQRRLKSLRNVITALEHAQGLHRELAQESMDASEDVERAVQDVLYERVGSHLSELDRLVEKPIASINNNNNSTSNSNSVENYDLGDSTNVRGLKLLVIHVLIFGFAVLVAFAMVPAFLAVCQNPFGGYLKGFLEGISAGALLGKIAGVLMPRVQHYSLRSSLSQGSKLVLAVAFFVGGSLCVLLATLIPTF